MGHHQSGGVAHHCLVLFFIFIAFFIFDIVTANDAEDGGECSNDGGKFRKKPLEIVVNGECTEGFYLCYSSAISPHSNGNSKPSQRFRINQLFSNAGEMATKCGYGQRGIKIYVKFYSDKMVSIEVESPFGTERPLKIAMGKILNINVDPTAEEFTSDERQVGFLNAMESGAHLADNIGLWMFALDLAIDGKPFINKSKGCQINYLEEPIVNITFFLQDPLDLACNRTMDIEGAKKNDIQMQLNACYLPQPAECNEWNTINYAICYFGNLPETLLLPNDISTNNAVRLCNIDSDDNKQRGLAVSICNRRVGFRENGTMVDGRKIYEIDYEVFVELSLSFSAMTKIFSKNFTLRGPGVLDDPNKMLYFVSKNVKDSRGIHLLTINLGTNSSKFATLSGPDGKILDETTMLESQMQQGKLSYQDIADGKYAYALLGPDIMKPWNDDNQNWKQHMSFSLEPSYRCSGVIVLELDGKAVDRKRLDCYERLSINYCDLIGREAFDAMLKDFEEYKRLLVECPCPDDDDSGEIPPERLKPVGPRAKPSDFFGDHNIKRRDVSEELKPLKECDNAEDLTIDDDIVVVKEMVDSMLARRQKCCSAPARVKRNVESHSSNMQHERQQQRRPKRQLFRGAKLWKTPIAYRFIEKSPKEWKTKIIEAIERIGQTTCVQFYLDKNEEVKYGYLLFVNDEKCRTMVGRLEQFPVQEININEGTCSNPARIVHEILHALGLVHEQSRSDRSQFVWINYGLILKNNSNYAKYDTDQRGMPYDFGSIMHYDAFLNGERTYLMVSKELVFQQTMGYVPDGLSFKDAKLLNMAYCSTAYPYADSSPLDGPQKRCGVETFNFNKSSCKNGGYLDPLAGCKVCRCSDFYTGKDCGSIKKIYFCGKELIATDSPQTLYYVYNHITKQCIWRIKTANKQNKLKSRIIIEIKKLGIGMPCKEPCWWTNHLEVKYKRDKTATGARICCDLGKPLVLNAEDYDTDILIILHIKNEPNEQTMQTILFELTYRTGLSNFHEASDCPPVTTLFNPNRSPDFPVLRCGHGTCDHITYSASWNCNWKNQFIINGVTLKPMKCTPNVIEKDPHCYETVQILCLKTAEDAHGEYYWKNVERNDEYERLTEVQCLVKNE